MTIRKLLLIKHAAPEIVPDVPPEQWALSERGRDLATRLAEAVEPYAPAVIVSSLEPKASETGEIVAARLGLAFETASGLHEHDRSNVPHLRSGQFISLMELMFRRPNERVLGRESAEEAGKRFGSAVDAVLADHPTGNVAIVSHGTVIALRASRAVGRSPFQLWREMGLPSFVVLTTPGDALEAIVLKVD